VQQSVANIRSQAELIYNSKNYTYEEVCGDPAVIELLNAATNVVNGDTYEDGDTGPAENDLLGDSTGRSAACNSANTVYAAAAPLATGDDGNGNGTFWCVDSTGASREVLAFAEDDTECGDGV
jgi:hypothetical protein